MAYKKYDKTFKEKIIKLNLYEGMHLGILSNKYNVPKTTISSWVKKFRDKEKCSNYCEDREILREICKDLQNENTFLKKAAIYFAKEINK
ncbi:transposase [Clostridium sulfidigenes]|uniref:transposase n=1 Tax=Clostridium sulfidigenes TaxID=318464 RepID=UPI003F89FA86